MSGLITTPERTFARVYCVNLDTRPDRWQRFSANVPPDWPFAPIERFSAVAGKRVPHPPYWKAGGGAWGCYRSHLRLIEQCLQDGVESVLLLEDDALFPADFTARTLDWLRHVPADWEMLYLGGQHLFARAHPPLKLGPDLYQPWNVNRTHAWALRGPGLRVVYQHLLTRDWHAGHHIDHHLGRLHMRRDRKIYCPPAWLIGQAGGKSNISGRSPPDRYWNGPAAIAAGTNPPPPPSPLVVVLGLHSSGSSALAGALGFLGLWIGTPDKLWGAWGTGTAVGGGEHRDLAAICEAAAPFGCTHPAKPRHWIWSQLRTWIAARQAEAHQRQTVALAKYPMLCRMGPQLHNLCGTALRVIHCDRPIAESIASLARRTGRDEDAIADHQRWLDAGKVRVLQQYPDHLTVTYSDLLADPTGQLQRCVDYLHLSPTAEQLAAAIAHVRKP
jgi:hypothetical protein